MNLSALSHQELFSFFADILVEMRRRDLCRTENNPVADLAEKLVALALHLELATKATAGYDAKDPTTGIRYQIKARRQLPGRKPAQFGVIRGIELKNFDFLAAILFNADFTVARAIVLPHETVVRLAVVNKHQNGCVLALKEAWSSPDARDITTEVRNVWERLPAAAD